MDAHYMKADEDCMGNPTRGYWRCFGHCSDGSSVIGTGATEDDAVIAATLAQQEREKYLALPPIDRLKILLDGDLLSTESKEAVKIIGRLVIDLCEKDYAQH